MSISSTNSSTNTIEDKNESEYGANDGHNVPGEKNIAKDHNHLEEQKGIDQEIRDLGPNYSRDPENDNLVYTDPDTKTQYILNSDKTDWILKSDCDNSSNTNYDFDGNTYYHTNSDGVRYKWDLSGEQWLRDDSKVSLGTENLTKPQNPEIIEEDEESEEDDNTTDEDRKRRQFRKRKAAPGWGQCKYSIDPDTGAQLYKEAGVGGMTYEWDPVKKAWFPRINEDFMAQYQMNYGFTPDGQHEPTKPEAPKETEIENKKAKVEKEKVAPKKPQWFEEENEKTTKVYVTGLPTSDDYNEEKFALLMGKVRSNYLLISIWLI